jgi:hypothetical protein
LRRLLHAAFDILRKGEKARISLSARVKCAVNFFQILAVDVCIDLRCRDVGMAEHFLHSSEISASF